MTDVPFIELTDEELDAAVQTEDYPPKVVNPETPDDAKANFEKRIVRLRNNKKDQPQQQQPKAKKPTPPKRKGSFTKPLTDLYTGVGVMIVPFDSVCGTAVMESAAQCAESLDALAYQNETVRRALDGLLQTSTVGTVVFAHLPIIMAVVSHHMPALHGGEPEDG